MSHSLAGPDSRFLFVTGLHRSGTSLVRDVIAQHPDTSTLRETNVIEDEGQFLQDVLPCINRPGRFAWHADHRYVETHADDQPGAAARMSASWAPYWRGAGSVFVEKSPENVIRGRFLARAFPNSSFVYVLRHPVAVSYATQKWTKFSKIQGSPRVPMIQLLRHWVHANTLAAIDIGFLGGRAMFIRYEDFVADPARTANLIYRFAGLDEFTADTDGIQVTGNDRYLTRWHARKDAPALNGCLTITSLKQQCEMFGYDITA